MNRKLPIRTYERKRCKEITISIERLHISTANSTSNVSERAPLKHVLNAIETNEPNDNSLHYDPFDTTFDRLARNARHQMQALKTYEKRESHVRTDDSSGNSATSPTTDHKRLLHDDFQLHAASVMPTLKRKLTRNKSKMQSIKKTMSRKNTSVLQNNGKSKVKKNNACEKYRLRKVRNRPQRTLSYLNIDSSVSDSETDISEIENHRSKHKKLRKRHINEKYAVRNNKKDDDRPHLSSFKDRKMKPCSVVLDGSNVIGYKNKMNSIKNNSTEEAQKHILENYKLSEHFENTKISNNNLKRDTVNMKHCFVKLVNLEVAPNVKPFTFGGKHENVISSTPIGRSIRSMARSISLSPIPIECPEKLNKPATCADNISITGKNECTSMEKIKLPVICLVNTNVNKCSLNQSEKLDRRSTDSLAIHCTSNNIHDQRDQLAKITSEGPLDSATNISAAEMRNNMADVPSAPTQEYVISNAVEKKHHLNFSVDVDRSRSMFGNTNEDVQTSLSRVEAANNVVEVSSTILISDESNKGSDNNMSSNSITLSKKSILNINNNEVDTICNKVKEVELDEMLSPVKLTFSETKDGVVEFKLATKTVDLRCNSTRNIIDETDSRFSRNNALSAGNSFVSNSENCNATELCTVFKQLQDPFRVTKRRKRYCKWELDLASVSEGNDVGNESKKGEAYSKRLRESRRIKLPRNALESLENITQLSINDTFVKIDKPIYLKPGKCWARSLSILNSIQNEFNLEELSIGKGKNWRYSVQDIMNMQKQGVIQSCIRSDGTDKELRVNNETINKFRHELVNNKGRTCDSTSLGRLSRRISVRVVPINKTIKSIEDAPFLEVYGIVPVKGQRVSLIYNAHDSVRCDIPNDDVDGEIIKEHTVSAAKEVILEKCAQKHYIPFSTYFSYSYVKHCRKIGEGVYGEVFLYEHEDRKSVIKIIPIEGNELVNGEPQKKFQEILSEIVIALELHNLRFNANYNTDGFVEVKNVKCLKGKYPEKLVELWNVYDEEKHSDNDCPSMFNDDQLYIVLELGHGGQDLEAFVFNTAEEAHILFVQAALALAVAEKAVEFEHRDLHWGNILISPTSESHVHYKLGQQKIVLASKGVKVSIIDFTLSRVRYQGCSVYNDLASDPALFTAQGEYQFEIYRLMKDKIKNNWKKFEPYTNILWLHYTLDKMITAVRYRRRYLKIHKRGIAKLEELKNEILKYNSAFDFVTNCDKVVSLLCTDAESELMSV
ncbi:haspin [Andrena cerasifolii]|uniref:haspin n=1 Tax=Andrena cerasifolii TaxID=2819439 RepID=UPI004037B045